MSENDIAGFWLLYLLRAVYRYERRRERSLHDGLLHCRFVAAIAKEKTMIISKSLETKVTQVDEGTARCESTRQRGKRQ